MSIVSRYWLLNGYNVILPGPLYDSAVANRTPTDFWGLANSLSCPRGQEPGSAWMLVTRALMDRLDVNGRHTLQVVHENGTTTFSQLVMKRAICAGKDGDGKAPFLIEFQDIRCLLRMTSIDKQYNVVAPAAIYDGEPLEKYHDETVADDDSPYTWQTMLDHVWGYIQPIAGNGPTLPYEPEGTPENWRFIGMSAWDAVGDIMQAIGCEIVFDPINVTFSVVRLGVTANTATTLADYRNRLLYDYKPKVILGNLMPETIRVFFPRREKHRGTERETPRTGNWEIDSYHSVDVETGVDGAASDSVLPIWDTAVAIFDFDGAVENETEIDDRANEVAQNKINEITISMQRNRLHYSGIVALLPNAEINEVIFRDYDDGDGLITEIRSNVLTGRDGGRLDDTTQTKRRRLFDDQRGHQHPHWPQYMHVVQIGSESESTEFGEPVEPNGDGYYSGYVVRFDPETGAYEDPEDQDEPEVCWVREVNAEDLGGGVLIKGERYLARLCGSHIDASDDGRAVFLIRGDNVQSLLVRADYLIANDSTGTCSVYSDYDTDTGINVTVRVAKYSPDIFKDEFVEVRMRNGEWTYEEDDKTIDGTLAGSMSQGSSATMNVDPGDDTVTVFDKCMKSGATALASGKKIIAAWFKLRRHWGLVQVECP